MSYYIVKRQNNDVYVVYTHRFIIYDVTIALFRRRCRLIFLNTITKHLKLQRLFWRRRIHGFLHVFTTEPCSSDMIIDRFFVGR